MSVFEKLLDVQKELKAPKNSYNSFGKYNYRSCEDILEGVKPVLDKVKATLIISDEIVQIGDRFYVKANARFVDIETGDAIQNTAYARESDDKRGMDSAQVTGATSSYARKYALNGLFLIDDTKDADTDEYQNQQRNNNQKKETKQPAKQTTQKPVQQTDVDKALSEEVDKDLVPHGEGMTPYRIARLKKAQSLIGKNDATILATAKSKTFEEITEANYIAVMNICLRNMTPDQKKEFDAFNG